MALQGRLADSHALTMLPLDLLDDSSLSAAWLQSTDDGAVLPAEDCELPQWASCAARRAPQWASCDYFDALAYLHWMEVYSCDGELDVSLSHQWSAARAIRQLRCRL